MLSWIVCLVSWPCFIWVMTFGLSCLCVVLSWLVLVFSCLALPCLVLSHLVLSCVGLSRLLLSCLVMRLASLCLGSLGLWVFGLGFGLSRGMGRDG